MVQYPTTPKRHQAGAFGWPVGEPLGHAAFRAVTNRMSPTSTA